MPHDPRVDVRECLERRRSGNTTSEQRATRIQGHNHPVHRIQLHGGSPLPVSRVPLRAGTALALRRAVQLGYRRGEPLAGCGRLGLLRWPAWSCPVPELAGAVEPVAVAADAPRAGNAGKAAALVGLSTEASSRRPRAASQRRPPQGSREEIGISSASGRFPAAGISGACPPPVEAALAARDVAVAEPAR